MVDLTKHLSTLVGDSGRFFESVYMGRCSRKRLSGNQGDGRDSVFSFFLLSLALEFLLHRTYVLPVYMDGSRVNSLQTKLMCDFFENFENSIVSLSMSSTESQSRPAATE